MKNNKTMYCKIELQLLNITHKAQQDTFVTQQPQPSAPPLHDNKVEQGKKQQERSTEAAGQEDAPDRCYMCWEEADLKLLPCKDCKQTSYRVCSTCIADNTMKNGTTKCPQCGDPMSDF